MLDQLGHGQLVRKLEHDFVSARSFWALAQSRGRGTSHDHQTGFPSTMSLEEVDAAGCSAMYSTVDWASERRRIDAGHER